MPQSVTKNVKVWKATKTASAGFMVSEKTAIMAGGKNDFIAVTRGEGVAISGKGISFMTTSENIRQGGLFVNMNDLVKMIPQTLTTPMPSQIPFPPLGMVSSVVKDLPFFLAMLV